ncbi:hypothetical protein MKY37_11800 [Psychrobacillus sp. FSL K6-2836]|uniref:hypothetical protein n=1 Tax=Psychrobacillus sp. FSL K6-2836 TaxID=2921548 RepID=UPI0030F6AA61
MGISSSFVKTSDIIGTDGNHYRFIFVQLTNDTDVLISQLLKVRKGHGKRQKLIHLNLLKNKRNWQNWLSKFILQQDKIMYISVVHLLE